MGVFLGLFFSFPLFFRGFFCSFPHGGLSKQAAEAPDRDSSRSDREGRGGGDSRVRGVSPPRALIHWEGNGAGGITGSELRDG